MAETSVLGPMLTASGAVVAAALTGFVTYRLAQWNMRKDLEVELRRQRLDAFRKLWALSQPLAKYGRSEPVTPAVIVRLSQDLRRWYFEEGGMFLSDASRDSYFEFQESLKKVIESKGSDETSLDDATFESLRKKGSQLRTTLRDSFSRFPEM